MGSEMCIRDREGNWGYVRWPFVLGIALAAVGGYMITKHAPKPPKPVPVAEQANS